MSFLWHGFNRDPIKRTNQCYYEWHCLTCFLRSAVDAVKLGRRLRR